MIGKTLEASTNCWTHAEQAFVDAIGASLAFADICETTQGSQVALDHVFLEEVNNDGEPFTMEDLERLRHFAVVTSSDEQPYRRVLANTKYLDAEGNIEVIVQRLIREGERVDATPHIAMRWFKNRVGDMMEQVATWLDDYGGPFPRSIIVEFGPRETKETMQPSQGFWLQCLLSVEWGFVAA